MIITIIMVYVLLELTVHTRAQYKDIVYLQNNIVESTNSSLSMFDLQEVSLVKCGSLCLLNQCCKEFLYSRHNQRCIGVHFADFQSTSAIISLAFSSFEGMLAYQKGCENGWLKFNGHCYKKSSSKATWANAKLECQKMCSYLVEIESKEESGWLATTFLDNANCRSDPFFDCTAWTGGNDLDTEGQYKWDHSNTLMSFTNWHYHEPSLGNPNQALNKDCIDMLRDGVWNDRPCSYSNSVICEKSFNKE
nr:neurocan core protein isoform X2 [Crassostrea gigas]